MSITSDKEKQILDSYREILWLRRYVAQLEEEDQTEDPVIPESATKENVEESSKLYRQHINEMRTEFDILTQYNKSKEEVAKVIDEHHFTLKALYPEPSDHHNMEIKKITEEFINKRDKMVIEFNEVLEALTAKKLKLVELQRDITRQHVITQETMAKIGKLEEGLVNNQIADQVDELRKSIAIQKDYLATIRGVLSGLILQSSCNYAEDENLLETMTRIGEEI